MMDQVYAKSLKFCGMRNKSETGRPHKKNPTPNWSRWTNFGPKQSQAFSFFFQLHGRKSTKLENENKMRKKKHRKYQFELAN